MVTEGLGGFTISLGGRLMEKRATAGGGSLGRSIQTTMPATSAPSIRQAAATRPGRLARCAAGGSITPVLAGSASASASSMRASPMSRSRLCGSFCKQRRSSARTIAGAVSGNASQSGSRDKTAAMQSESVSPGNARRLLSSSYNTHPNDQMSVRLSKGFPRACSGLMYAAVPRILPSLAPSVVNVGDWGKSASAGAA